MMLRMHKIQIRCKNLAKRTISNKTLNVNEVLPEELHKPVIKNFKRRKFYARLKDNIWAADKAQMGCLSSKN